MPRQLLYAYRMKLQLYIESQTLARFARAKQSLRINPFQFDNFFFYIYLYIFIYTRALLYQIGVVSRAREEPSPLARHMLYVQVCVAKCLFFFLESMQFSLWRRWFRWFSFSCSILSWLDDGDWAAENNFFFYDMIIGTFFFIMIVYTQRKKKEILSMQFVFLCKYIYISCT